MDYNLRRQQLVFVHLLPDKNTKSIKYQVLELVTNLNSWL